VRLRRVVATLDTMRSVATLYPEFQYRREHSAHGYFLGPEELMRLKVTYTNDIVRRFPGMRVEGYGPQAKVSARRGGGKFVCAPNVVVNDVEGWSLGDVHPKDIGAVEVYPAASPSGVFGPWLYDKGCGAIVIWTKRGR
jgi:hypothetical protein